jgi:hypothetical protein
MARFLAALLVALPVMALGAELPAAQDRSCSETASCPPRDVDDAPHSEEEGALSLSLLQAGAARSLARRTPSAAQPTQGLLGSEGAPKLLFFQHHKTGTVLSSQIARDMANVLNVSHEHVTWGDIMLNPSVACPEGLIGSYEDMRVPVLQRILLDCPNMRAVHLIREAASNVVSNYVYTKNLQWGEEVLPDLLIMKSYNHMSVEEGMTYECTRDTEVYFPQMVETHEMIQNLGLESIMTVRYEDWMANYDNVTMAMLEHLLGPHHPQLGEIFRRAKVHDMNTWNETQLEATHHVSDTEQKDEAADYLLSMYNAGNECARSLVDVNRRLGYDNFWPPNASLVDVSMRPLVKWPPIW